MVQPVDPSNQSRPDYKAQLDEAATRTKNPPKPQESPGIIDKVSQYVPVVGKVLGSEEKEPSGESPLPGESAPGPPVRPMHDAQIEEFLKDQHRSKKVDEIPDGSAQ